jgi:YbgC/YbaW family acyl-CoA thioester hydrolase
MKRLHIEFPGNSIFKTQIKLRITDINYGNHLGNDALISIIHEARVQMLQHFGFSEMDIGGAGIIMSNLAVQYKSQAFYGDVLLLEMAIDDFSATACTMYYKVSCNDKMIALAQTGIVCYDYAKEKVTALPQVFIKAMQRQAE